MSGYNVEDPVIVFFANKMGRRHHVRDVDGAMRGVARLLPQQPRHPIARYIQRDRI